MSDSIFKIYVHPKYKDLINYIVGISVFIIIFHILVSDQSSLGLVGEIFNSNFSNTFGKIIISISFYFLVFNRLVSFL